MKERNAFPLVMLLLLATPLTTVPAVAAEVIAGVTTQQQMVESFDKPSRVIDEPDGGQTWVYPRVEGEPLPPAKPAKPEPFTWLLRFDRQGILVEHKLVSDKGWWVGETQQPDKNLGQEL